MLAHKCTTYSLKNVSFHFFICMHLLFILHFSFSFSDLNIVSDQFFSYLCECMGALLYITYTQIYNTFICAHIYKHTHMHIYIYTYTHICRSYKLLIKYVLKPIFPRYIISHQLPGDRVFI